MIRVYFRTNRNRISSRLYKSNYVNTTRAGGLQLNNNVYNTVEEEGRPHFWPWRKPTIIKRRRSTLSYVAEFAPGEWMRWEAANEPEKKEKKSAKSPEVRT